MTIPVDHRRRSDYTVSDGRSHFVYRCYDATDRLLYVGCSVSPVIRIDTHRDSWWGGRIERVRYTVFPDRDYALAMERIAIHAEMPLCNVKGRWYKRDPRDHWVAQDYLDFHHAVLSAASVLGVYTSKLLGQVESELLARFGVTPVTKWRAA